MKITGNEPANPVLTQSPSLQNETSLGLTIRQQFAMAAMQGQLSAIPDGLTIAGVKSVIESSVMLADALIAELNK